MPKRVDVIQPAVVEALRKAGCSVQRYEIVIPDWVPPAELSINGRRRGGWRQTWRLQQDVQQRVIVAIWQADWFPQARSQVQPIQRARVTVAFTFPTKRRRDPDGLAGRIKPCLDALVCERLIEDDSTEHIELVTKAVVEQAMTRTVITIEEIADVQGDGFK